MNISSSCSKLKTYLKKDIIPSITITGIFLAIIIVLNYIFDLFKGFGGYSIQVFLVFYAIGIYKIKNIIASLFLLIIAPIILFFLEQGPWIKNFFQVFIEYFLVFYIFGLLYITRIITWKVESKQSQLSIKKTWITIDFILFAISYIVLICIKFLIHSAASYFFWLESKSWIAALSYNLLGVLVNGFMTVPLLIIVAPLILYFFDKYNFLNKNKF